VCVCDVIVEKICSCAVKFPNVTLGSERENISETERYDETVEAFSHTCLAPNCTDNSLCGNHSAVDSEQSIRVDSFGTVETASTDSPGSSKLMQDHVKCSAAAEATGLLACQSQAALSSVSEGLSRDGRLLL